MLATSCPLLLALINSLCGIARASQCTWSVEHMVGTGTGDCGRLYESGEITLRESLKYGRIEAKIKFSSQWSDGVVATFFLFQNQSDKTFGSAWNEIDYEVHLGGPNAMRGTPIQTNVVQGSVWAAKPGRTLQELFHNPIGPGEMPGRNSQVQKFIRSDWHNLAIEWTDSYVEWWLDGHRLRRCPSDLCCSKSTQKEHCVNGNLIKNLQKSNPMQLRMALWAIHPSESWAKSWVGIPDPSSFPATIYVDSISVYDYLPHVKSFLWRFTEDFKSYSTGGAENDSAFTNRWSVSSHTFDVNMAQFSSDRVHVVEQSSGHKLLALSIDRKSSSYSPQQPSSSIGSDSLSRLISSQYQTLESIDELERRPITWQSLCTSSDYKKEAYVNRLENQIFVYGTILSSEVLATTHIESSKSLEWALEQCALSCIAIARSQKENGCRFFTVTHQLKEIEKMQCMRYSSSGKPQVVQPPYRGSSGALCAETSALQSLNYLGVVGDALVDGTRSNGNQGGDITTDGPPISAGDILGGVLAGAGATSSLLGGMGGLLGGAGNKKTTESPMVSSQQTLQPHEDTKPSVSITTTTTTTETPQKKHSIQIIPPSTTDAPEVTVDQSTTATTTEQQQIYETTTATTTTTTTDRPSSKKSEEQQIYRNVVGSWVLGDPSSFDDRVLSIRILGINFDLLTIPERVLAITEKIRSIIEDRLSLHRGSVRFFQVTRGSVIVEFQMDGYNLLTVENMLKKVVSSSGSSSSMQLDPDHPLSRSRSGKPHPRANIAGLGAQNPKIAFLTAKPQTTADCLLDDPFCQSHPTTTTTTTVAAPLLKEDGPRGKNGLKSAEDITKTKDSVVKAFMASLSKNFITIGIVGLVVVALLLAASYLILLRHRSLQRRKTLANNKTGISAAAGLTLSKSGILETTKDSCRDDATLLQEEESLTISPLSSPMTSSRACV